MLDGAAKLRAVFFRVMEVRILWFAAFALVLCGAVCPFVFLRGDSPPEGEGAIKTRETIERSGTQPVAASAGMTIDRKPLTEKERSAYRERLSGLPDEDAVALLVPLAGVDMNAAFELALELGARDGRWETAREALRGLIGRDFETAIAWGNHGTPSPAMELFWAAAADLTTGSDPITALDFSARTSGSLRLTLVENTFAEWAGEDLEAAKSAAMNLGSLEERTAAHVAILNSASGEDFGKTLAWIETVEEPELQDALYYHAAKDWAARDPGAAAGFAGALVESDYKTHLAGMVLESWIKQDPDSAMAWSSRLKDQESREEAVSRGIRQTFETAPEKAAAISLKLPGESERAAAIEYVISAWVERDPDALAEWIGNVPDPVTRTRMAQMMDDHLLPDGR